MNFVTTAAVRRDLPFDPVNDLAPVGLVATSPLVMTVHPSLPVRKVSELIALARARPGQILYATSGSGRILRLGIEQFAGAAQLRLEHVPYKSGVPAVTNTISGEIQRVVTLYVVESRLAAEGAEAAPTLPEALGRMMRAELEKWRALATKLNIRLEAAPAAGA